MEIIIKKNSRIIKIDIGEFKFLTKEKLEELETEIGGVEEIEIPDGVEEIEQYAFCSFENLKKVKFPNSLKFISEGMFAYCDNLEEVEISDEVETIEEFAFFECENLKRVNFPKKLNKIGSQAFSDCVSLEEIELSEGIEMIEENAFYCCNNIKKITIPKSVKQIGKYAFSDCLNVKEIDFLGTVDLINSFAFSDCENLETIKFCEGAGKIEMGVFGSCHNVEKIEINDEIKDIGLWMFFDCENIKEMKINNPNNLIEIIYNFGIDEDKIENFKYFYINNSSKELICSAEKTNFSENYNEINNEKIDWLKEKYSYENKIKSVLVLSCVENEKIDKIGNMGYILPDILENCDIRTFENKYKGIIDNNDKFNNMLKQIRKITKCEFLDKKTEYVDIFYFAHTLGAFNENEKERQTACEFIVNAFQQNQFNMRMLHSALDMFVPLDYSEEIKKEWAKFLMNKNNFKELIEIEKEQHGYISRVYKLFESIREFGRKSNGSQNYRQVTVDMCKRYFDEIVFNNVSERDIDINETLFKYIDLRNQESFDDAVSIREEYLKLKNEGKIQEHILGEELKEKDVFEKIQKERENTLDATKDVLELLDNVSKKNFTYEFLSKYDAMNFALGKYCSCCAHLQGAGYGIMKASVLHPSCQNLVIRDDEGRIVAKSTLYINTKQGYGVFNNIEVENNIAMFEEEKLYDIYDKYMEAVDSFAKRYNEINKDNPIRQINVGMNLNDLDTQLYMYNKKSDEILEGINFSKYGRRKQNYAGDWHKEQFIVWPQKNKEEKVKKK